MPLLTHPTKEQVRALMARRARSTAPPPTPEQIRRELGWHMIADERKPKP